MSETTTSSGFSAEERAAMRQRAKELKAQESAADPCALSSFARWRIAARSSAVNPDVCFVSLM